jgi:hypothetical protein
MTYNHRANMSVAGKSGTGFGSQVNDGNRVAIQGLGSGFTTTDGAASPIVSPITASATATKITLPPYAARLIISATTACTVSEDVNFASSLAVGVGATITLDVGRQDAVYVKGSGAVSFAIQVID